MYIFRIICGLTQFTNKCHIAFAALEAVCFQTREVINMGLFPVLNPPLLFLYKFYIYIYIFIYARSLWKFNKLILVVQSLSHVRLFVTPWTAARQASLSFTISWSLLKLMSLSQWCHPLLLQPSIFPSIRVFSNESAHIPYEVYEVSLSFSHVWLFVTPLTAACKAPVCGIL